MRICYRESNIRIGFQSRLESIEHLGDLIDTLCIIIVAHREQARTHLLDEHFCRLRHRYEVLFGICHWHIERCGTQWIAHGDIDLTHRLRESMEQRNQQLLVRQNNRRTRQILTTSRNNIRQDAMHFMHLPYRRWDGDEGDITNVVTRSRESRVGNRESRGEKAKIIFHKKRCLVLRITEIRTIVVKIEIRSVHRL